MTQRPGNSQGLVVGVYSNDADELNENKKESVKSARFQRSRSDTHQQLEVGAKVGNLGRASPCGSTPSHVVSVTLALFPLFKLSSRDFPVGSSISVRHFDPTPASVRSE